MLRSLRYLTYLPPQRLVAYSLLLLAYVVGCAAILRLALRDRRLPMAREIAVLLMLCGLGPAAYDLALGHFHTLHVSRGNNEADLRTERAAHAPMASLLELLYIDYNRDSKGGPGVPLASALNRALMQLPLGSQPNVVLVLTESWGLANDDRINQAQIEPYRNPDIDRIYRVETGKVEFLGGTTSGETRELCNDSRGRSNLSDSPADYKSCWPSRMAGAGYHVLAVHGFSPYMFERKSWYEHLGFAKSVFLPDFERAGAALCDGAFPGACDGDVAEWIAEQLLDVHASQPLFIHWVTLNSHLPVAPLQGKPFRQACAAVGIEEQVGLCSWFNHVLVVQRSVAQIALRRGLRQTIFVVVGDHAPPFLQSASRNQFSQNSVPWVILMPRSLSAANPSSTLQPARLGGGTTHSLP